MDNLLNSKFWKNFDGLNTLIDMSLKFKEAITMISAFSAYTYLFVIGYVEFIQIIVIFILLFLYHLIQQREKEYAKLKQKLEYAEEKLDTLSREQDEFCKKFRDEFQTEPCSIPAQLWEDITQHREVDFDQVVYLLKLIDCHSKLYEEIRTTCNKHLKTVKDCLNSRDARGLNNSVFIIYFEKMGEDLACEAKKYLQTKGIVCNIFEYDEHSYLYSAKFCKRAIFVEGGKENRGRFRTAISQLAGNAVKHSGTERFVTISSTMPRGVKKNDWLKFEDWDNNATSASANGLFKQLEERIKQ